MSMVHHGQSGAKNAETKSWRLSTDATKPNPSPGLSRVTSDLVHETPVPVPVPKAGWQGGRLSLPPSVRRPIPSQGSATPASVPAKMASNLLSQHRGIEKAQQKWKQEQTAHHNDAVSLSSRDDSDTASDSDSESSEQGRKTETPVPLPSGVLLMPNELKTANAAASSGEQTGQLAQDNQAVSPDTSLYSADGSEVVNRRRASSEDSLPPLEEVATAAQLMERVRREHSSNANSSVSSPNAVPAPKASIARTSAPRSRSTNPQTSGTLHPIRETTEGRLYNEYPDSFGKLVNTKGALIPAGYKEHDDPEYPFICPVRNCRRIFAQLFGLGGHFGPGHRHATFNDNGDGTLTQIGTYKNSSGSSPCIVISRHPLPPDAPPMSEPSLPVAAAYYAKRRANDNLYAASPQPKRRATGVAVEAAQASTSSAAHSPQTPAELSRGDINPLDYLFSILCPNHPRYGRSDIDRLSKFTFQRRLPEAWLQLYSGKAIGVKNFACALAFVVGTKRTGANACHKTLEVNDAVLSGICVGLPHGAPAAVKAAFSKYTTCVGCNYLASATGRRNECEWSEENEWKDQGFTLATGVEGDYGPPGHWRQTNVPLAQESKQPDYSSLREKVARFPSPTTDGSSIGKQVEATIASSRERRRTANPDVFYGIPQVADDARDSRLAGPSASLEMSHDQTQVDSFQPGQFGAEDFEMEEWEVAPGRVTNRDQSQNIAYSGTFLTSSVPIIISPDICFNVQVLLPGKMIKIEAQRDKFQVFSVAAGKVRVKVGGETIQLGPNGALPLHPGMGCVIENRLYFNAVVHCTTVKEYEMQDS